MDPRNETALVDYARRMAEALEAIRDLMGGGVIVPTSPTGPVTNKGK